VLNQNIYIRPLSSVQTKFAFILHEPSFGWAESWWKHVLLRFVDLLF